MKAAVEVNLAKFSFHSVLYVSRFGIRILKDIRKRSGATFSKFKSIGHSHHHCCVSNFVVAIVSLVAHHDDFLSLQALDQV